MMQVSKADYEMLSLTENIVLYAISQKKYDRVHRKMGTYTQLIVYLPTAYTIFTQINEFHPISGNLKTFPAEKYTHLQQKPSNRVKKIDYT